MRRETVNSIRFSFDKVPASSEDQRGAGSFVLSIPDAIGCAGQEHNRLYTIELPLAEIEHVQKLQRLLGAAIKSPLPQRRGHRSSTFQAILKHGRQLNNVIDSATHGFLSSHLQSNAAGGKRTLILLQFGDGAKGLSSCLWEGMSSDRTRLFLENYTIARFVSAGRDPSHLRPVTGKRLRVLCVVSTFSENGIEDPTLKKLAEEEIASLRDALCDGQAVSLVDPLRVLWNPTPREVLDELKREIHVLHFYGHGGYDVGKGEFIVLLSPETGRGSRLYLRGDDVALLFNLSDCPNLRLVVVNSCDPKSKGDFGSRLVGSLRVPAAITMTNFIDGGVIAHRDGFSRALYSAISEGHSVDRAYAAALQSILFLSPVDAFVPRLTLGSVEPLTLVEPDDSQIEQLGDDTVSQVIEDLNREFHQMQLSGSHERFREAIQAARPHQRNRRIVAALNRMFSRLSEKARHQRVSGQLQESWKNLETLEAMADAVLARKADVQGLRSEFAHELQELKQNILRVAHRAQQDNDPLLLVAALEHFVEAWPYDESMRQLLSKAKAAPEGDQQEQPNEGVTVNDP